MQNTVCIFTSIFSNSLKLWATKAHCIVVHYVDLWSTLSSCPSRRIAGGNESSLLKSAPQSQVYSSQVCFSKAARDFQVKIFKLLLPPPRPKYWAGETVLFILRFDLFLDQDLLNRQDFFLLLKIYCFEGNNWWSVVTFIQQIFSKLTA